MKIWNEFYSYTILKPNILGLHLWMTSLAFLDKGKEKGRILNIKYLAGDIRTASFNDVDYPFSQWRVIGPLRMKYVIQLAAIAADRLLSKKV